MTRTIDLTAHDAPSRLKADVCLIGAGAAGSFLAHRLARRGVDVILLEAGADDTRSGAEMGFDPDIVSTRYNGAFEGRAFGLGGTTARWGGVLIPHSKLDLGDATRPDPAWSHIVDVVARRSDAVRQILGVNGPAEYEEFPRRALGRVAHELESSDVALGSAEMLPFQTRNLRRLIEGDDASVHPITIVVNAVASGWSFVPDGSTARVTEVVARSRSGRTLTVNARDVVICAGALESARILLEFDAASNGQALLGRGNVGCGLGDHLSSRIGGVIRDDVALAAKQFAPEFRTGMLKTIRLSDKPLLREGVRHFAHFVFPIENPGFELAKKVLFGIQGRSIPKVSIGEMVRGSVGLAALGFDRVVRSKLHVPADTAVGLQIDVEQVPAPENRITLTSTRDEYGRLKAQVAWRITEEDRRRIERCKQAVLATWSKLGASVPRVAPYSDDLAESKPHDAYHPVGVTRLGTDDHAVVDPWLRARGTANLYVAGTGVFPSAGTANPTFSMLCLADGLADTLASAPRSLA